MATTTTNFGLNIVEGSDIVNPLIYDNPNYRKIDEQMFTNQNNSIPKATYSKSGTKHQIARSIKTANLFWFVASANYNSGDTFTVDGGAVTATLPDGTGLENNAFVVNSNVICALNGTNMTIYAAKQSVNNAKTANKLATPVKIGSASFDGSQSITLAQMGAADASKSIVSLSQNNFKLGNGICVEWGEVDVENIPVQTPSGGLYAGTGPSVSLISNFTAPPIVTASFIASAGAYAFACPVGVTNTRIGNFTLVRGTASSSLNGKIHYIAIGPTT